METQMAELVLQLQMFDKIRRLYNIDFDVEVAKIEKRISYLRQALAA